MSVNEYGFFTSKNHDRVYTADDFVGYFKDIMTDGILGRNTASMAVSADDGMRISVSAGTAYIGGRWLRKSAPLTLTLSNADTAYGRYDAVAVRCDFSARAIYITAIEGIPSSEPQKPVPVRNEEYHDLILAYIYIDANKVEITQSDITDTRGDTSLCGWVTGAVNQIDTTALFAQYEVQWQLLKAACAEDAEGVIAAWNSLNAVKTVLGISPVNGNIFFTLDDVPDGENYKKPIIETGVFTTTGGTSTVNTVTLGYRPSAVITSSKDGELQATSPYAYLIIDGYGGQHNGAVYATITDTGLTLKGANANSTIHYIAFANC